MGCRVPIKLIVAGEIPGFHIAGAKNFPSTEIVNEHGIKPPAELRKGMSEFILQTR